MLSQVITRQLTLLERQLKAIIILKSQTDSNPKTRMSRPKLFSKTMFFKVQLLPNYIVILSLINAILGLSN